MRILPLKGDRGSSIDDVRVTVAAGSQLGTQKFCYFDKMCNMYVQQANFHKLKK